MCHKRARRHTPNNKPIHKNSLFFSRPLSHISLAIVAAVNMREKGGGEGGWSGAVELYGTYLWPALPTEHIPVAMKTVASFVQGVYVVI